MVAQLWSFGTVVTCLQREGSGGTLPVIGPEFEKISSTILAWPANRLLEKVVSSDLGRAMPSVLFAYRRLQFLDERP